MVYCDHVVSNPRPKIEVTSKPVQPVEVAPANAKEESVTAEAVADESKKKSGRKPNNKK